MNLFNSKNGIVTANDFSKKLEAFNLQSKNVIVYSRLLSLGRFFGKDAVITFLGIIKDHIGTEGTLVIPTYTLNSYKEPRVFDFKKSNIMSGILGEIASKQTGFSRTVHPVYSNTITGKYTDALMEQDATTCFGERSLFDLFSKLENAFVMMIGLNFNGPTLYHYYDQKYKAPGRFVKQFYIKMVLETYQFDMRFDSFVKNYDFYEGKMNCLARFDSLVQKLGFMQTEEIGDDFIHCISEKNFQSCYKAALAVSQEYFLLAPNAVWEEYFMKNNFKLFHGEMDEALFSQVQGELTKHAG